MKPTTPLAYPQPKSRVAQFFWRRKIWFETTFAFSMLVPWEKTLLLTIFTLLFVLVLTGLFKYLPAHVVFMRRRLVYYLWGQEGDERFLWQWFNGGVGSLKEL